MKRNVASLVVTITSFGTLAFGTLSLGMLAACKKEESAKVSEKTGAKVATDEKSPEKGAEKAGAKPLVASPRRSSPECVGAFSEEPVKSVTIAGKEWEQKGSTLREKATDGDETMVVGVISDLKEDSADNLTNIDRYLSFFKQEKVELIIVDGDTGENKGQIVNNLKRIAQSGLPVGIIIGNRECRADFNDAVKDVQQKAPNVFNLNAVRHIVADDAEFVTIPGYYNASYLHCAEGCAYFEEDVMALSPIVEKPSKKALVMVSHGPPRQSGPNAIDRISEGTNEGDPSLAKLIAEKKIPFGIFANIHEAGGHATDLAGESIIKEGVFTDTLYLNPGPGDSVRWTMNNGTESVGMAAIVTFKGNQAAYKIFKATPQVAKKK